MTLLLLAALALPAQAGDFMDTWVTLALEDDNVFAGPEDQSPAANFVIRGNRTFFEDYESRYTDDITQSRLVLYRRDEAFWKGWFSEAAFVIRFSPYLDPDLTEEGVQLYDDGSYVRIVKTFDGDEDHNLSFTGYAVDASRFRLGYSYDLSWGGREMFIQDPGASPGIRLQYENHGSYVFVGAKTAIQDEKQPDGDSRNQTYWGFLSGAGLNVADRFRVEGGAGWFRQGQFYNLDVDNPYYGLDIVAVGGAAQVAWRSTTRLAFIKSSDLRLYRNAPDFVKDTYIRHNQLDGTGLLVQSEVNALVHNLMDSNQDNFVYETGVAGDVQAILVHRNAEFDLDFVYKDLPFIVFTVPGYTSGMALPDDYVTKPQFYWRFKYSQYLEQLRLAPYLGVGIMQPASYEYKGQVTVQRSATNPDVAPEGEKAQDILGAIAGMQFDVSPSTVLVGELTFERDPNKTHAALADPNDEYSDVIRVPADPNEQNMLGFNLMMRARF